jgi:predicted CXXCH cytochrome family protein
MRLQSFSHLRSQYVRPTQRWVCGWTASGRPCRIGPNRHGECQARFECEPVLVGDRWECTRPPTAGGKCAGGPLGDGTCSCALAPCAPVRSERARRGRLIFYTFAALLAVVAVLLGGKHADSLIQPGRLSPQHAGIADCGACHTTFGAGPAGWLHAAFVRAVPKDAGKPCLACHEIGAQPLEAHSLDAQALTALGKTLFVSLHPDASQAAAADVRLSPVATSGGACSNCHREHEGTRMPLTQVSDAICQTCHMQPFHSFADGHPEFGSYPYRRRTRIVFDHAQHYDRDFAQVDKSLVPADCTSCHALDPKGETVVLTPFEQSCGACHLDQIRGKEATGDKGIAVLAAPVLDLDTLAARGAAIGSWPENSDAEMMPFLRFLLSRDQATAKDFATLGPLALDDLRQADADQITAATHIAWRIKELLYDLGTEGPAALVRVAGAKSDASDASLVAGLPPDAVRAAEADWFPGLADEVKRHREGAPVPMTHKAPPAPIAPRSAAGGGGEAHAAILGGGGGGLLGGAVASPPAATGAASSAPILGGGGGLLGAPPAPAPKPAEPPTQAAILGGGGLLGGTPPAPNAGGNAPILGAGGGLLAASPPQAAGQSAVIGAGQPLAPPEPQAAPKPVDAETWAAIGGGWYRSSDALYYRPAVHADPFLQDWLDRTGREAADPSGPAARLFAALSASNAPGVCAKCHSIDRSADGALAVNWHPQLPDFTTHGFTKFAHAPHLSLFGMDGCKSCHQTNEKADYAATYKGNDPLTFAAGFEPVTRQACAQCHVASRAPDSCITCHDYHVGTVASAPGNRTVDVLHAAASGSMR